MTAPTDPKAIVIASAARTAVGAFNGAFATVPAHELGAAVITAALERAGVAAADVDEVILGQVLTAGEGQNPARQAAMQRAAPRKPRALPSTSSAARACARWRSACSRYSPAMPG